MSRMAGSLLVVARGLQRKGCYNPTSTSIRRQPKQQRSITTKSNNPFTILGVPPDCSYETARQAFVKLALEYHPDTAGDSKNDKKTQQQNFVKIRKAFESIRNAHQNDTGVMNADETLYEWSEEDFLHWFHEQTGIKLSSTQRRELVRLHQSRIPGAYYSGQHWAIAQRLVQEQDAFLRSKENYQQNKYGVKPPVRTSPSDSPVPNQKESSHRNLRRTRRR